MLSTTMPDDPRKLSHLRLINHLHSDHRDVNSMHIISRKGGAAARRGYAICTSPRSGSNLLCQLLASTCMLGRPLEYFNGPSRRILDHPDFPDDPRRQIDWTLTVGCTPNGIYGLKLFAYQHATVSATLDWTAPLPELTLIQLVRRDTLGQALSWARALQTEQYRTRQQSKREAVYDADLIGTSLASLQQEEKRWQDFFAIRSEAALQIVYEDLITDPQRDIDRIAGLFDFTAARIDWSRIDVAIQRDSETEVWRRRYLTQ